MRHEYSAGTELEIDAYVRVVQQTVKRQWGSVHAARSMHVARRISDSFELNDVTLHING
jgi:hypothetical protein